MNYQSKIQKTIGTNKIIPPIDACPGSCVGDCSTQCGVNGCSSSCASNCGRGCAFECTAKVGNGTPGFSINNECQS